MSRSGREGEKPVDRRQALRRVLRQRPFQFLPEVEDVGAHHGGGEAVERLDEEPDLLEDLLVREGAEFPVLAHRVQVRSRDDLESPEADEVGVDGVEHLRRPDGVFVGPAVAP
jgi:hypothetical protein